MRNHSHRVNRNGRENPNEYGTSVDIIIYTKMAWSGKRQLQSASESLLNNFEFIESALVCHRKCRFFVFDSLSSLQ